MNANMQALIDFFNEETGKKPNSAEDFARAVERTEFIGNYLERCSSKAKDRVVDRVGERNMIVVMKMLEGMILSNMDDGEMMILSLASSTGALEKYTHNVCMAILGIAMDEEIV